MSRMSLYIARQLVVGILLVTTVLCMLIWLTQSLRFVDLIINKGLSATAFLELTALLLPSFLSVVLPVATFAVVLFTYNRLIGDREIVVLQAAGVSSWRIAWPGVAVSVLVGGALLFLSLFLIPDSVRGFREMQWAVRNDLSRLLLQEGAFTQISADLTVYVRERGTDNELYGILVHDTRNPDKTVTWMAERGALLQTENGPRVLMVNGNSQELRTGSHQLSLLYFDSYTLDFGMSPNDQQERFRDARERSLGELVSAKPGPILSETDIRRFRVEAHQRLSSPLGPLAYTLAALAILLTGEFNRRGQGKRLLLAIGLMVAGQLIYLGAGNLASRDLILAPLIYAVNLLPVVIAGYVLIWPPGSRIPRGKAPAKPAAHPSSA